MAGSFLVDPQSFWIHVGYRDEIRVFEAGFTSPNKGAWNNGIDLFTILLVFR